ncbi:putative ABC transport system permease protein [Formivibrio citricus]|uniref:Putative ABC transport system permease protein n=1 Tax=Formivibrio citricus TaxID=83765 RepID=A0A1I4Y9M4_9NEIS|nr:ABC transporter permease [Formivibrio citricus]SFN34737.1 putative ABC transport system permease protein [Formivibrio citricus]
MLTLLIRFALRNTLRHRLRSSLTVLGIVVAILAFGLLRTVVSAWYAGADAASDKRLIVRNSISLIFPLPLSYAEKLRGMEGVTAIGWMNWFNGVYIDERNFFPQFAVDRNSHFNLYPEFILPPEQLRAFQNDRRGAVVGRKLANRFGWKIGDTVPLKGTIYPGTWEFVVRGIYSGRHANTDEGQFLFQWDYLNERMRQTAPGRVNQIGIYLLQIRDGRDAAAISRRVDAEFKNSLAETLTETEKAFNLGFIAMTGAIVNAIQIVSFVVIVIIMAVMANTMAMAARERIAEYATLKALGFAPRIVAGLVYAESLLLALIGGAIGIAATEPAARIVGTQLDNIFPVFNVAPETVWMQLAACTIVGLSAAVIPAARAMRVRIVDGLRAVA